MIYTGGQGDKVIAKLGSDTCVIERHLFNIVVEIIKLFLGISLEKLIELKYIV